MQIDREDRQMKEFLLLVASTISYVWVMLYCIGRLIKWNEERKNEK